MTNYRRIRIPGASWFFTVALADRHARLLVEHPDALRAALQTVRRRHPFHLDAIVLLPDHLHCVWTLPPGDADYSTRWGLIKANFSRALAPDEHRSPSRTRRGERGIWQRRFWEHCIRDETDHSRHLDYVHWNPVKHGHIRRVADWPWSSFHRYARAGVYPWDWCGGAGVELCGVE